jgi:hypothetical protein
VLIYQVVRYEPKRFSQRRPDGHDGWIANVKGVSPLLYRLPELIAAPKDAWLLVPEGEKDVDNLVAIGFVATTNSGGAGKFPPESVQHFQNRRVALLPHNDSAGMVHGRKVAALLAPVAHEVRIIEPPAAMPAKGDISDLIAAGWSRELIDDLIARAPKYQAQIAIPLICEDEDQVPAIARQAWKALDRCNHPTRLFLFNHVPIRLEVDQRRVQLDVHRLRDEMTTAADWVGKKFQPRRPSVDLANLMLASRSIPLPQVNRFATSPVFDGDGWLISRPGFDERSGIYLLDDVGVDVPERPDAEDVTGAVALLEELFIDFPFASNADKAGAYALAIERPVRELIDGPLPLHGVTAPVPGTGKGLLVESIFTIHNISPSVWTEACDDAEIRKALSTFFLNGAEALYLDNVVQLVSSVLASANTARRWKDRLLGTNREIDVPIRNSWVYTANNPTVSAELLRRSSGIHLVPKTEHPEERSDFVHPDLRAWVKEQRPALLRAVLILIRNWLAKKRPAPKTLSRLGPMRVGQW